MRNEKVYRIRDDGWSSIWIDEYVNGGSAKTIETFAGYGSWDKNMTAAKNRLSEILKAEANRE